MVNNSGINKIILLGQIKETPDSNELDVLSFVLITKESIKRGIEKIEHLEYHFIKVPQKLVTDDILLMQQGQTLYIEGKIQTVSSYDEHNIRRYRSEIIASKVEVTELVTSNSLKEV